MPSRRQTRPPRPRNAAATRAAIVDSARRAFARAGYDGAGVREIAAGAGVTAMLVNRYFGSKEQLFAEAVTATMADPTILRPENLASEKLAEIIAATLVDITQPNAGPLEGFLIALNSASSTRAAEIARPRIEQGHQRVLSAALKGPLASERAALILSIVAGLQMMRQMLKLAPLAEARRADLVRLLTPVFKALVTPAKDR